MREKNRDIKRDREGTERDSEINPLAIGDRERDIEKSKGGRENKGERMKERER